LIIPIIENTAFEADLEESMAQESFSDWLLTLIGELPGYKLDRFLENSSKTERIVEK